MCAHKSAQKAKKSTNNIRDRVAMVRAFVVNVLIRIAILLWKE